MHWRYDDVRDLPAEVFAVLVEELTSEAQAVAGAPVPGGEDDPLWR